jgi:outer membrane protein assembly factor BamB
MIVLPRRQGKLTLWASAALFLVFLVLTAYQLFHANRRRFAPDPELQRQLSSAPLSSDELVLAPNAYPWPQWRGPNRDGAVHSKRPLLEDWSAGPTVLWRTEAADGYSSFAVGRNKVFTLVTQADGQEAIVCFAAGPGQQGAPRELWRHAYRPSKPDYDYGGPRSTPTLDEDRLYVVGSAGLLLCFEADTGKVVWHYDLRAQLRAPDPRWGFAFSPLVEGDRVFTSPGGTKGRSLAAFDKRSGKLLWSALDDVAGYSSPIAVTIDGAQQIVFLTGTRLVGVTPDEGKLLWSYPWKTSFDVNAATPLAFHATSEGKQLTYVFISSGYEKGCGLIKITGEGGRFLAQRVYESNELCCHFSSPVRQGHHVYGLDEKRDLTCLDLLTGAVCWRQTGFFKGSLLRVDGNLLVLGEKGRLSLVEANPTEFRERARARPLRSDRCWTMPVLADGFLYLRDQKRLLCLDLRKPR